MRFISDKTTFTEAMKKFANETLENKLARILPEPTSVDVKLTKLNNDMFKVDLAVEKFRAQATDQDFYAAFFEAANKVKTIIVKNNKKDKHDSEKSQLDIFDLGIEDPQPIRLISKEKIFELKPITVEEAIEQLEYTDYVFYVFKNIDDNNSVSIIYLRRNGDYGLIKCV